MSSSARWWVNRCGRRAAQATLCSAVVLVLAGCSAVLDQPTATSTPSTIQVTPSAPATDAGCQVVEAPPTPAGSAALIQEDPDEPSLGPPDASVTVLFYCDLQSPQCEIFSRVLDKLQKDHGKDLRLVFRPYPVAETAVPALNKSEISVQAVFAADGQHKFWEMRELLHTHYAEWTVLSKRDFRTWLIEQAKGIVPDPAQFAVDLDSSATISRAKDAYATASALGISSIPTVFINGQLQPRAALSYAGLDSTIGLIALGSHQFRACPPFDIDPARQYTAALHTEKGDVTILLDPANAPLAVNSFVFLARQGWYDGSSFHRVVPGFLAQGGDPSGTGRGGPGYYIANEITASAVFDRAGVVALANSGPDTNGSQFFITYAPQPQLDGSYTVFGHVVNGMQVLESLTARDAVTTANPPPGDKILSVSIEVR